ncbi:MAG: metallophosphoesterase family protein [Telluria sp.]
MRRPVLLLLLAILSLAGCATAPREPAGVVTSFVVLGPDGAALARVLTSGPACPVLTVDGAAFPLGERAAPARLPARPLARNKQEPTGADYPVRVCERVLPAGARSASLGSEQLPLPTPAVRRIVVIGDTGCRLIASSRTYQDCNNPAAYPFATVARSAAAFRPDLVIHVGDYHYREDPCPPGRPGCAGSPSGSGWAVSQADFFAPAAPLLRAAPWVFVRGNHEECDRAGRAWWRLFDPRPLLRGRDCLNAADDLQGNHGAPYAVPLGQGAQLVVLDTADADYKGFAPGSPRRAAFVADARRLAELAAQQPHTIVAAHHPLLAYGGRTGPDGAPRFYGGDASLIDAYGAINPALYPAGVDFILSGHVHAWEQLSFASGHPSQFVAGFSGTAEDLVPLPATPPAVGPAPGAVVERLSSWIDGFGYMTLERLGEQRWEARVWDRDGRLRNRCLVEARRSSCDLDQVPRAPAVTP